MSRDQTEAIILRTLSIGDLDKMVVFLSQNKGLLKGVAKGARKFGSRFGSSLEPMSLVKIFYYEKERKDLLTISHCDLVDSFFEIQRDTEVAFTLAYFAEIIEEFCPARTGEEVLFRLLLSCLTALREKADLPFITCYFEAWFLRINGFLPDFRRCKKCRREFREPGWLAPKRDGLVCDACASLKKDEVKPVLKEFLFWVKKNPPSLKSPHPFTNGDLEAVGKTLREVIIFHLEKEPRTLRYLKEEGRIFR